MIAILFFIVAGICLFEGVFVENVVLDLYPSMYGWNIAAYVLAGFFALWSVIELFRFIRHKLRRRKARKAAVFTEFKVNTQKRRSTPKNVKPDSRQTKKAPAGKPAGKRKRGK